MGHVGEWHLSSGDVIKHKVHDDAVYRMALSGDWIVTFDTCYVIRVSNVVTCLFVSTSLLLTEKLWYS